MSNVISSSEWVKVTAVSCAQQSAKPTFEVTWDTTESPPGRKFLIGLFEVSGDNPLVVSDAIRGGEGTITASKDLDQSTAYDIRVTQWSSGNPGHWPESGPPALFVAPTDLQANYSGRELVTSWTNPEAGTTPTGGCLYVVVNGDDYTFKLNGNGGAIDTSGIPLDPSHQVTVYVRPTYDVSTGPPSNSVNLVLVTYELILIDNRGTNPRTIRIEGFQQGNSRTFDADLLANGGGVQSFEGLQEDGQGNIAINLDNQPVAGALYQLRVRLVKPGSLGPLSRPAAMVIAPVSVDQITYAPGQANDVVGFALQLPPGEPFVSGAQITVQETGTGTAVITQQVVTGSSGSIQVPHLTDNQNYKVEFRPALGLPGGVSLGPASDLTPSLLTFAPAISSVSYNGSLAKAEWSASTQAGVSGYELEMVIDGIVISSARFPSTKGAIAFQSDRSLPYQLRVRAIGSASTGAASSSPVTLITGAPVVSSASTDPVAGTTKVSWNTFEGATGYLVQLYVEGLPSGQPVSAPGTDYTLPDPLAPDANLAIAVAAVKSASGVTVTGPLSESFRLPTTQPALLEVDYDGESAAATWSPAPGATGYIISVIASGTSQPVYQTEAPATATRARFNPAISDNAKTYSVVMQATVNGNSGPPTAPAPLFEPAFFVSTQQATTSYPYVFPSTSLALSPADITIYLADLGGGTPIQRLPPTIGPFTLARNTDSNTNVFPYMLMIPASSQAWQFGTEPIRTELQENYVDFLKAAEDAGVVEQGIATIQQAISRYMPQTFQETLYYAYGLDLIGGWADLRPGMILRVAFNNYMSVSGSPIPQWLNGYTGGSVLDYEVGSYLSPQGSWAVGFDAFIAQLVTNAVVQVSAPPSSVPQKTEAGMAEASDLFYPAFIQPFYRLFFPSKLQTPTGIGSVVTTNNFVIASAPTYTILSNTVNYPTVSNAIAYFRGRAVVKLCIRITVNGVDEVVPIGTTIGNILDRYGRQPPSAPVRLEGLRLDRTLGPVVLDALSGYSAGRSYQVRVSWGSLAVYGPARNALSLPLMHGDCLTISSSK